MIKFTQIVLAVFPNDYVTTIYALDTYGRIWQRLTTTGWTLIDNPIEDNERGED